MEQRANNLGLNDNHRRVLLTGFAHVDRLLTDALLKLRSESPFSAGAQDLGPVELLVVEGYIRQLRQQLVAGLASLGIELPRAENVASNGLAIAVAFADVTMDDINPSRLKGYGSLDAEAASSIERVQAEIVRTLSRLRTYLKQGTRRDLKGRLERLAQTPVDPELLRVVERIVRDRNFVEFLPALESIIDRLESPGFEVAVFGRVSSGKSSLLNAILEMDVLPTGVTPVTAVPTRIAWARDPGIAVIYADAAPLRASLAELPDFVTEAGNPGNERRVRLVTVRVPSPVLETGVILVDTPGVGSLALAGAKASYAYLPRCDHGVVLVDASGALADEDLQLLRLLLEAGVTASVVIGKADLLSLSDRERMLSYVKNQIERVLGVHLPIDAVSAVQNGGALARKWYQESLAPSAEHAKEMSAASVRRKLRAIAEGIEAALRGSNPGAPTGDGTRLVSIVRSVDGALLDARREVEQLRARPDHWINAVLVRAVSSLAGRHLDDAALEVALRQAARDAAEAHRVEARDRLLRLRDRLLAALAEIASVANRSSPNPDDLAPDLLSEPVLVLPETPFGLHAGLSKWLNGVPALQAKHLRARLGPTAEALGGALSSFASSLAAWSDTQIRRLGEQFGAIADPMRARPDRPASSDDGTAEDLALLERLLSGSGSR